MSADELSRICGRFKAACFGSSLETFFERHTHKGATTLKREELRQIFRRALKIPVRELSDAEIDEFIKRNEGVPPKRGSANHLGAGPSVGSGACVNGEL